MILVDRFREKSFAIIMLACYSGQVTIINDDVKCNSERESFLYQRVIDESTFCTTLGLPMEYNSCRRSVRGLASDALCEGSS